MHISKEYINQSITILSRYGHIQHLFQRPFFMAFLIDKNHILGVQLKRLNLSPKLNPLCKWIPKNEIKLSFADSSL